MTPKTYTQLYLQLVFAVKNRETVLTPGIRNEIFRYLSSILTSLKHKSIIVNGYSDHVHLFYGLNPNISVSDTAYQLKRDSSLFINKKHLCLGHFAWQEGYGCFSYSRSDIENVYNYIQNQEMHHKKITFREEYIKWLETFKIEYDSKYLFDFFY